MKSQKRHGKTITAWVSDELHTLIGERAKEMRLDKSVLVRAALIQSLLHHPLLREALGQECESDGEQTSRSAFGYPPKKTRPSMTPANVSAFHARRSSGPHFVNSQTQYTLPACSAPVPHQTKVVRPTEPILSDVGERSTARWLNRQNSSRHNGLSLNAEPSDRTTPRPKSVIHSLATLPVDQASASNYLSRSGLTSRKLFAGIGNANLPAWERVRIVPLTRGQGAVIDAWDLPIVEQFSWSAKFNRQTVYAVATGGLLMHTLLMGTPTGMQVDHIDRDGLNNMPHNLRVVTCAENLRNRRVYHTSQTGFKCVAWDPHQKSYRAYIKRDGKTRTLGRRKTAEEAYQLYLDAAHAYEVEQVNRMAAQQAAKRAYSPTAIGGAA